MLRLEVDAHQREAIMSTTEFRDLFDSYDGLTPAQRMYGNIGISAVYENYKTSVPRDRKYYDTGDNKNTPRVIDMLNSDWYPEVDFVSTEKVITADSIASVKLISHQVCLVEAA